MKKLEERIKNRNSIFFSNPNTIKNDLESHCFKENWKKKLEQGNLLKENIFIFDDEWDMERCAEPVIFSEGIDWTHKYRGDEEWMFMLNRHKFLVTLIQCYIHTNDSSYLTKFEELLNDWLIREPFSEDKFWSTWRTIEMGIRLNNWIHALDLLVFFGKISNLSQDLYKKWIDSIFFHVEYMLSEKNLHMVYSSNWKILEMNGVFLAGIYFEKKDWIKVSLEVLEEAVDIQVEQDGFHWEQSFMYHHEVMISLAEVVHVGKQNANHSRKLLTKVKDMLTASMYLTTPKIMQPAFGDSDEEDMQSLFTLMGYILKNSNAVYLGGNNLSIDHYLVVGDVTYRKEILHKEVLYKSKNFSQIGLTFLRSPDIPSLYSYFKCGPHGGGHAHADQFHISIYKNEPLLIDSGRYTYKENSSKRIEYKAAKSHNTFIIDNEEFTEQDGSWGYKKVAQSLEHSAMLNKHIEYIRASHDGYLKNKNILVNREIIYFHEGIWIILDSAFAKGEHSYKQFFNFPSKNVELLENNYWAYEGENEKLFVHIVDPKNVSTEISYYSPEYNQEIEIYQGIHKYTVKDYMWQPSILTVDEKISLFRVDVTNKFLQPIDAPYVKTIGFEFKKKKYILITIQQIKQPSPPRRVFYVRGCPITERLCCLEETTDGWQKTILFN
jgi:hypothetical protein